MITIVKYGDFPQIRRRVKNPIFYRVPHPLPWFIVEVYDTRMDFLTMENHRAESLFREKLSISELFNKWDLDPQWAIEQDFGLILSQSHWTDLWIKVTKYPGYLSPT